MLNSTHHLHQAGEISLTEFRKVISQTLNSDQLQIINVKKGKKKVIVDLSVFENMYQAYQNEQWQKNLEQLQDSLATQVISEIGQSEYERINSLSDLDEVVESSRRLMNQKSTKYATKHH
jgi:UDP-galactopyranose mutase